MKRILAIIRRDLLATTRDYLLLYITLSPWLLTLIFRLFVPAVGQSAITVVVTADVPPAVAEALGAYAHVDVARDRAALDRRVNAYDDAVGIVPAPGGGYTLVVEGNESHDATALPSLVLQRIHAGQSGLVLDSAVVTGDRLPYREIIGAFVALSVLFISGISMGFHIIEDKESRMMLALGASPLGRREYVAARALLAAAISTVSVFGSLWILGLGRFDHLQVLALTVISTLAVALVGFAIGALSANQVAGIATVKFGFLLIVGPAAASLFVEGWLSYLLYWLPPYWIFAGYRTVLEQGVGWGKLAPLLAWNLGTTLLLVAAGYGWLKQRLDFARN